MKIKLQKDLILQKVKIYNIIQKIIVIVIEIIIMKMIKDNQKYQKIKLQDNKIKKKTAYNKKENYNNQ